jgi:hypothetical protein
MSRPAQPPRRRRLLTALLLVALAIVIVVAESFPKGDVLLKLTHHHGVGRDHAPRRQRASASKSPETRA